MIKDNDLIHSIESEYLHNKDARESYKRYHVISEKDYNLLNDSNRVRDLLSCLQKHDNTIYLVVKREGYVGFVYYTPIKNIEQITKMGLLRSKRTDATLFDGFYCFKNSRDGARDLIKYLNFHYGVWNLDGIKNLNHLTVVTGFYAGSYYDAYRQDKRFIVLDEENIPIEKMNNLNEFFAQYEIDVESEIKCEADSFTLFP